MLMIGRDSKLDNLNVAAILLSSTGNQQIQIGEFKIELLTDI